MPMSFQKRRVFGDACSVLRLTGTAFEAGYNGIGSSAAIDIYSISIPRHRAPLAVPSTSTTHEEYIL